MPKRFIVKAYLWPDGDIYLFDQYGDNVEKFKRADPQVYRAIVLREAPPDAKWFLDATYLQEPIEVSKEEWDWMLHQELARSSTG